MSQTPRSLLLRLATAAGLCAAAFTCEARPITCPASIPVLQSIPAGGVEDWTLFDTHQGSGYRFYGVTFSDGPPAGRVFLSPARTARSKHSKVDVYEFASAGIEHVWVSCLYRDTSLAISKAIEGQTSGCRVTYDPRTGFESVKEIDCE